MLFGIMQNATVQAFIFGYDSEPLRANFMDMFERVQAEDYSLEANNAQLMEGVELAKEGTWSWCLYEAPEGAEYEVDLKEVVVTEDIAPGSIFTVEMTFENTGDLRIFGAKSDCEHETFIVSTRLDEGEGSRFGAEPIYGWENESDIKMKDEYADPGEEFSVVFQSHAPEGDDIYREFYQGHVGDSWLDEMFALDVEVGNPTESMRDNIQYVSLKPMAASELEGLERNFEINLSEQVMYARFGEEQIWSMQISSGAWATPTPVGNYKILNMQELRIGYAAPHYHMPYWMGWRSDGYGIHGLPYLADDGGVFWEEAVEHLGIPVSHGCIRVAPDHIATAYEFADIGMAMNIHY